MTSEPPGSFRDWEHRLRQLLALPDADENAFGAVATILGNIAHLFVYLEGNRRYLDDRALLTWREALLDDTDGRRALLTFLSAVRCEDEAEERVRRTWLAELGDLLDHDEPELRSQELDLQESIERVLELVAKDRADLLTRLGMAPASTTPEVLFFQVISKLASPASRAKLALAWDRLRDRRSGELADLVDRMIHLRWLRARQNGQDSPLARTLARSTLTEPEAEAFVADYLAEAISGHERLTSQIRTATECTDDPMNHFAFCLRRLSTGVDLPLIPLRACLDVAVSVIESVFGYVVVTPVIAGEEVTLTVYAGERLMGMIQVDLLRSGTVGGRTSIRSKGSALPVGRSLGRYQLGRGGELLLSFDSVHSLLHEFGHALTRVLVREERPPLTGLEYLPVERLEDLSAWFEKWAYHESLAAHAGLGAEARRGLTICRQVKMLEFLSTNLQRAVVGALDLEIHRRPCGIREAFRRIDDQFSVERYCHLGDLLGYFIRPVFRTYPGCAGLTYLWSYAYGAERFGPFHQFDLANAMPGALGARLDSCFHPAKPSERPDIPTVRSFYEPSLSALRLSAP